MYEDTEDDGHFYADLCEYIDFSQAVGYYDAPSGSWEPSKTMRSSVRRIDDQLYEQLCSNGGVLTAPSINALTSNVERITRELHALLSNGKIPKDPGILRKVKRILPLYERPSAVTNHVKAIRGDRCQLCGVRGFVMRNGRRYCEIHHVFHLANDPPVDCLKAEYVVVLCATCHRRMHYAQVSIPQRHDSGWTLDVDGDRVYFDTYFQAAN